MASWRQPASENGSYDDNSINGGVISKRLSGGVMKNSISMGASIWHLYQWQAKWHRSISNQTAKCNESDYLADGIIEISGIKRIDVVISAWQCSIEEQLNR